MTLLLAFLIGVLAGLRSNTPMAAVGWAAYLGWLKVTGLLSWVGALPFVILVSLLAISELILDKHPKTPSRTAPPGLITRIMTGGFTGACISVGGGQSAFVGAGLGVIGALAGCFGGYHARAWLVKLLRLPDFVVALLEDAVAIGGSLFIVSRF